MSRLLFALSVASFLLPLAHADEAKSEKAVLAELKELAAPIDPKKSADLDADDLKELHNKQAKRALALAKQFEGDFGKSASLADARLHALEAISQCVTMATDREAIALAKRLRGSTEKGTDHAAQADMFLVSADIRAALGEAKSGDQFASVWKKNEDAFRKKIATYLDDHPKYRPAADALRELLTLLDLAGDTRTRDLIVASVSKNLPDHPLARTAALHRMVGKEFDLTFTPVGADKPVALKDLRGKVVVVNFWASWCVPCQAASKQLAALQKKHGKDEVVVIGFSLDEKEKAAKRFAEKHALVGHQVVGKEARAIGEKFAVETVPAQFVIGRDGKLVTVDAIGRLPELLAKLTKKE